LQSDKNAVTPCPYRGLSKEVARSQPAIFARAHRFSVRFPPRAQVYAFSITLEIFPESIDIIHFDSEYN
jgi:hypothetical protein